MLPPDMKPRKDTVDEWNSWVSHTDGSVTEQELKDPPVVLDVFDLRMGENQDVV